MLDALGGPAGKAALVDVLTAAVTSHLTAYCREHGNSSSTSTWARRLLPPAAASHDSGGEGSVTGGLIKTWMSASVEVFLNNDLFTAAVDFLNDARGSFGMAMMCSLDHDR